MIATRALLGLLAGLAAIGLLIPVWPKTAGLWNLALGLAATLAAIDAWLAWKPRKLSAEREIPQAMAVGVWQNIPLTLRNEGKARVESTVFDHHPDEGEVDALPQTVSLEPGTSITLFYRFKPLKRGDAQFGAVELRRYSPLRLWLKNQRIPQPQQVRIYPNYRTVVEYALLATEHRLSQMGIRKRQRRGVGMDFHQLREFRDGDSPSQVDWKATSRAQKLISREFQDERDQEIIFLVDAGRRMLAHDGPLSHFDHTLNAIILLAYVALRQGDAVGLTTFGAGNSRWMKPIKGLGATQTVLNQIYDLHPGLSNPDYATAARDLLVRQRRRALIVLITNLRDEDPEELIPAIQLMKQRHLLVIANLREQAIDSAIAKKANDFDDALSVSSSVEYAEGRESALQRIRARGVQCIDVTPEELPISLVNRYLDIKSSGSL